MTKHYKDMMDEIINKMDEDSQMGYVVKFAKSKGGKISTAWYKSEADAKKALDMLKKDGLNGIISRGPMDEDAPANATGTAVAGTGDDNSVHTKKSELTKGMLKRDPLSLAKPVKTFKEKIREGDDNNNVVLKGVLDKIDSIEVKIDELTEPKGELKVEEVKEYKTFKNKYNV